MKRMQYNDFLKCIVNYEFNDIYYIAEDNKFVLTRFERYVENNTVREENVSYYYDGIDMLDLINDLLYMKEQSINEKILNKIKEQTEKLLKYLDLD